LNALLLNNLKQSVSVAHQSTTTASASGLPTYGTATAYAARISPKDVRSVDKDGVVIVTHSDVIILPDTAGVLKTDQLTLPGGEKRTVLEVRPIYDLKGTLDHYEVTV